MPRWQQMNATLTGTVGEPTSTKPTPPAGGHLIESADGFLEVWGPTKPESGTRSLTVYLKVATPDELRPTFGKASAARDARVDAGAGASDGRRAT